MVDETEDREFSISLPAILKDYIPHQLLQDVDEKKASGLKSVDLIRFYMKNSNGKLRMYGNAKQLEKNLEIYWKFPLNRKKYPVEMVDIDNPISYDCLNLKGDLMYCKQDFVFYLHHSIHKCFEFKNIPENLLEYMKKQMKSLDGCYEFVKYDEEYIDRIEEYFPHLLSAQIISEIFPILNKKVKTNSELRKVDYIKVLDGLLSDYPEHFLPNCEVKNSEKVTAAVRIFEDSKLQKFVMESELFNAINLKNPDQKPLESEDKNGCLRTIWMKEVYEKYRDQISGIDFIRFEIQRTPHGAVPIATPSGDHCILACDALFEILRRLIFALNIFQKVKRNSWHMIDKYVKLLDKYFPPDIDCIYFINLNVIEQLKLETDEYWKQFDKKSVKSIRDVGPKGITVEDIKKELKYLGLTDIFPEITNNLQDISSSLFPDKKLKNLGTFEMFQIIEKLQMVRFLDRFSSLTKMLHSQKVCLKLPFFSCQKCVEMFGKMKVIGELLNEFEWSDEEGEGEGTDEETGEDEEENEETETETEKEEEAEEEKTEEKETKEEEAKEEETEREKERRECDSILQKIYEMIREVREIDFSYKIRKLKKLDIKDLIFERKIKDLKISIDRRNAARKSMEETKKLMDLNNEKETSLRAELEKTKELVAEIRASIKEKDIEMAHIKKLVDLSSENEKKDEEIKRLMLEHMERNAKEFSELLTDREEEISRLNQVNTRLVKEHNETIRKLRNKQTQNASKLSEKNKKLATQIAELKSLENQRKKAEIAEKDQIIKEIQESTTAEISGQKKANEQLAVALHETRKAAEIDRNQMENNLQMMLLENEQLRTSTSQQIEEQTRINRELHETISIMSDRYEQQAQAAVAEKARQDEVIKRLLARISSITDPKYSEEGPCPFRKQLMGLRKMKDNLEVRSPLKLAKDISQRLITLSTCPRIQEMATYEYQQFEGKHQILLQEVVGNIQKLKEYGDVMAFPPLPEYPSFSDQFVNEYWNEIEKQKTLISSESTDSGVLEDSECLICFAEMKEGEQTLQCDHCRKILHLECASKWLKIHRSCPHCRREQLDPNEFPALN